MKEAELENKQPKPQESHNPLNILLSSELARLNKKLLNNDVAGNDDVVGNEDMANNDRELIDDVEGYVAYGDILVEVERIWILS